MSKRAWLVRPALSLVALAVIIAPLPVGEGCRSCSGH